MPSQSEALLILLISTTYRFSHNEQINFLLRIAAASQADPPHKWRCAALQTRSARTSNYIVNIVRFSPYSFEYPCCLGSPREFDLPMLRLCAAREISLKRNITHKSTNYRLQATTLAPNPFVDRHVSLAQRQWIRTYSTPRESKFTDESDLNPEDEIPLLEYDESLFTTIEASVKKRLEEKINASYVSVRDAGSYTFSCVFEGLGCHGSIFLRLYFADFFRCRFIPPLRKSLKIPLFDFRTPLLAQISYQF